MANKRRATADRTLAQYETEWRSTGKKMLLRKAVERCASRRLHEPIWLRDALVKLGRALIMKLQKTGRKTDLMRDDVLYAMVEDYREKNVSNHRAFEWTARDYYNNPKQYFTVRNAWLRHQKRIVRLDPANDPFGSEWRIKTKYLKHDINPWTVEMLPEYLKPKKK